MRVAGFVMVAGLMFAAPAFAQTDPAPQAPTEATEPAPVEPTPPPTLVAAVAAAHEIFCLTVQRAVRRLRSRRERICGTQAEWDRMEAEAADTVRGSGVQGRQD